MYIFYNIVYFRVIHDISRQIGGEHIKWQREALEAIHCGAESFLVKLMENSNYAAIHAGRVTIQAKDIQLIMHIFDVKDGYKTDSPVTGLKKGITVTEDDRRKQLELLKEGRLKGKKRSYLESESEDSDASRKKKESGDSSSSDNGKSGNKGKPKSMKDKVEKKGDTSSGDSSSSDNRKRDKKGKLKWMKDKVEKKDGDKSKGKPGHKNEDGADKSKGKDGNKSKGKGKSGANSKGKRLLQNQVLVVQE